MFREHVVESSVTLPTDNRRTLGRCCPIHASRKVLHTRYSTGVCRKTRRLTLTVDALVIMSFSCLD